MDAYVEAAERFDFDREKFRELVVYVSRQCEDDPTFGAVKLNKILYYADFAAFRSLHRPITGASYQKLREGPAPREFLEIRRELIDSGDVSVEYREYFTGRQHRLVVDRARQADLRWFSEDELDLVDTIIGFFRGKTAREVSDFSHREPGWMLANDGEAIPYETAWLSADPIDQETEEAIREMGIN
ncbi:MAG: Panacea domain-containing protein [Chloroflexota bacterium]|nr:Panacea domain-containing protein [Chloroflexota bacterium]MDE2886155.1 Panacea domain-containing protein [Chloroflexota bacterium]